MQELYSFLLFHSFNDLFLAMDTGIEIFKPILKKKKIDGEGYIWPLLRWKISG